MTDHFLDNMEDWSLEAVVRESSGDHFSKILDSGKASMEFSGAGHEFIPSFPDIFDGWVYSGDELEELYKPFYPGSRTSLRPENDGDGFLQENRPDPDRKAPPPPLQAGESDRSSASSCAAKVCHDVYTPKYKRRKNQQKRVIIQVSADCLGSDMWAWRKYGQKPIKGSPYPRSYYRCSSSKGCLARKQVEQSCTDPGMFIITYTAEHSHSQPTRRNSLAGTIRQKFPNPKSPIHVVKQETNPTPDSDLQAANSSAADNLCVPQNRIMKQETEEEDDQVLFRFSGEYGCNDESYYNEFAMSDPLLNDDFFSGLDLDGFLSECHA